MINDQKYAVPNSYFSQKPSFFHTKKKFPDYAQNLNFFPDCMYAYKNWYIRGIQKRRWKLLVKKKKQKTQMPI